MNNSHLMAMLGSLREAREELVSRVVREDPDLFSSFFDFEKSDAMLELTFEREFLFFIDSNIKAFMRYGNVLEEDAYAVAVKKAIAALADSRDITNIQAGDISALIMHKVEIIDELFSVSRKSDDRLNVLKYNSARDRVLFDRLIKDLQTEGGGNGVS